ncbi:hypothetical protein PTSG_09941 [Salpingoeca rosetta]|uniref:TM2 domain-containing protein n=1 Tax=Salpingoeca rosetta (strain ATCC 50818 / BSB-021) TaxID=946362 RepID=F2UNL5_SALR5|nr:uncharacterized protein PTSG_09941 [Salpingoeca rosetta]EGD79220.1 hypothetical protein PTSG_09941 [Salpingoeca rosetta]|eukprot:XP_004989305.1 hypothetical protein PTSG_09941 [Salpingoeca rosetta]
MMAGEGRRREPQRTSFGVWVRWLLFGGFGAHHYYLKRDFQAFLWAISFGGFGIGLIYDMFRINTYLDEVNKTSVFMVNRRQLLQASRKPAVLAVRTIGQLIFAMYLRFIAFWAVPQDPRFSLPWPTGIAGIFGGLAAAWTVANIGDLGYRKGNTRGAFIGAMVMEALLAAALRDEAGEVDHVKYGDAGSCFWVAVVAIAAYAWSRRYLSPQEMAALPRPSGWWRALRYFFRVALFWALVTSAFAFHSRIELNEKEDTVAGHCYVYINSPQWEEHKQAFYLFYIQCSADFDECKRQIWEAIEGPSARADS